MTIKKYVGSVINLAGGFSQATRPKNVGQLSDLIQKYREGYEKVSLNGWEKFYDKEVGLETIDEASDKIWDYVKDIKKNLNSLQKKDVREWTKDLIINKTFSGLQLQLDILEIVSETGKYRLSTPEEESKGIDGVVDGEYVSIKPHSYKSTIASKKEKIKYRTIYYKNTFKKGLVIL